MANLRYRTGEEASMQFCAFGLVSTKNATDIRGNESIEATPSDGLHYPQGIPYGNMKIFDYETIATHNQKLAAKGSEAAARVRETPGIFQNERWSIHQCSKRVSLRKEMPLNTCFAYFKGSLLILRPSCH
ncbi:hypothetical protein AVEN_250342-1 [Araneus ventricosus]|uniref:Uncharacterized protein n=1 Tax=Araneus ventricosus TaxID=182803 RepID=A0A4Y2JW78_ARAVE|nr:hypothetical protein AVEN_250342-1 [Araneus ventricosus]